MESFSYLGVIFSSNMKWNDHVNFIVKKASRRIFIIRNLRRSGCCKILLLRCYVAFIRSVLAYSFPSFCNLSQYLLKDIVRVESRISRIIDMDIEESFVFATNKSCVKLFQTITTEACHPLRSLFIPKPSRAISTRSSSDFYPPRAKTSRFSNSFIKFCK